MTQPRICFINIPQSNSLDPLLDVPLGLLYVAAAARNAGATISYVDLAFPDATIPEADIYALSIHTPSYSAALRIRDRCRTINPSSLLMVGGPHPTALPVPTSRDFDIIIQGEGEWAISDIIRSRRFHPHIAARQPITDVDGLALPARDIVPIHDYHRRVGQDQATSIITARGCPFACSFCSSSIMFEQVRYRCPDAVVDELTMLRDQYNFRSFAFYDDTFVLNRRRLYPLLDQISKLGVTFRCNGRAGYNVYDDFVRLRAAGCHTVSFGIESGAQSILDAINKHATVADNLAVIRSAKRAGLITKAFLIVGLPGETPATIQATKDFIDEADPDSFTLFTAVPYPGTDLYDNPADYGITITDHDFDHYYVIADQGTGGIVMETDTYSQAQLVEMRSDLLAHLAKRRWSGTIEDYERRVKWRDFGQGQ